MRCVYLGMDSLEGYVSDADLSIPPMQALGWQVDKRSWRDQDVDWDDVQLVYICTPWDYHEQLDDFVRALEAIDASNALLVNSLATVRWNAVKTYLGELGRRGVPIVPTEWHDDFDARVVRQAFERLGCDRLVIKPTVGASALDTHVLDSAALPDVEGRLSATFRQRPFMLQPFIDSVQSLGEYSLFFFDRDYSHAILKRPKSGDFRSQEEHGSDILPHAADPGLITHAMSVVEAIETPHFYARVDILPDANGAPLLMELELIEPSLYFRTDPASADRFARALTDYYRRETSQ